MCVCDMNLFPKMGKLKEDILNLILKSQDYRPHITRVYKNNIFFFNTSVTYV